MRQSQKISKVIDIYSYRRCWQQTLALLSILLFSLGSSSVFAAVTCDAGFVSDNFSNADYGKLASNSPPPTTGADKLLDGIISENYVLAANSFSISGSLDSGGKNTYKSTVTDRIQNFEFFQDFATPETTRTVSYTFKNEFTGQAQELNKVSLSVYDIDSNVSLEPNIFRPRYFEFFDEVNITGFTSLGTPVSPTLSSKGSTITDSAPYRQQNTNGDFNCSGLSNDCKVSVTFNEPVARVDVVYGNKTDLNYYWQRKSNNPGDQLINIVFDGYCYKPQPRLTYKKELSGSRGANTDQFTVQIKDNADNSVVTNSITTTTTTGTGNTITNGTGTTGTFKVDPTKTYTLTELGTGNTNLANYSDAYVCRRADNSIVTPLDPKNLKLTYGDSWTCTVTNSLKPYTFTGFVFNDNGNIAENNSSNLNTNTKSDISSTFTGNQKYFNGIFDDGEKGISDSKLQIRLTDCSSTDGGTNITGTTAKAVSAAAATLGQYRFTVPVSALNGKRKICLVQVEPDLWEYSIDTTPNIREIELVTGTFNYKTESDGSRNLDFGEVKANYASLVLIKSQYVNDCDINNNYDGTTGTSSQTVVFSTDTITNIAPGKCIAYKIDAYNRGHVNLKDIEITDKLQSKTVTSTFALPFPIGKPTTVYSNNTILPTETIISNKFNLDKSTSTTATKATLYFNTKYGITNSSNP
ncbi:hypothetical protein M0N77_04325 [Psychrobacter sp. AH5]|uniref:hypothetical protein n=1 Tax=Psychrobacter sp. AH5 TaxID=2937433 RepID=UPI0033401B6E